LRHGLTIIIVLLVIEYLVVPELIGASKNLHLLSHVNIGWVIAGTAFEIGSVVSYAQLTRTLLPGNRPPLFRFVRIVLATTAVAHVIPGGAAGGAGLGYQLLTANGIDGADAGFALAAEAIGSAIVLNVLLWIALVISIPLAGLHPIYVVVALLGLLASFATTGLLYAFTRGEERAARVVRSVGRRIPRLGADRLEHLLRQAGDSVGRLAGNRAQVRRALSWAAVNWVLDAASLWAFVAAFGHYVDPAELFAVYGIANVLAVIPITPGGLGIIEASASALLVSFGLTKNIATLSVIGWRLVNFWLPVPIGAVAYLSLTVPRRAGLRARRRALTDMTAVARSGQSVSPASRSHPSSSP
jgi:uncharacterized protein (TIRG00374 family)